MRGALGSCCGGAAISPRIRTNGQLELKISLNPGPFCVGNALVNSIAEASFPGDHVLAQCAFLFCPDT